MSPESTTPIAPPPPRLPPPDAPEVAARAATPMVEITHVTVRYGGKPAVKDVSLTLPKGQVTAFIGPSGCGKSTLLRALNRMNDLVEGATLEGTILVGGRNIYAPDVDVSDLRRRVGMVFQKSNPFPKSIFENVAYGPRLLGVRRRAALAPIVERTLTQAALWDEVKDRLDESALRLSGGQQQRLCIARALAVEPEVLLLDEPCSALDPIATAKIEDLLLGLRGAYTVVIVTHNIQQAARISEQTAFLLMGELVEFTPTQTFFTSPADPRTEDFITGRFG